MKEIYKSENVPLSSTSNKDINLNKYEENDNLFFNSNSWQNLINFCRSKLIYIVIIITLFGINLKLVFDERKNCCVCREPIDYKRKRFIEDYYLVNNDYIKETIEDIDNNILMPIQSKLEGNIEINLDEQKFLNGIIRKFLPKKIVEIGVGGGGTSALILNAIKDIPDAKLYSIDKNKQWINNPKKKTGIIVQKYFSEFLDKWRLYTGEDVIEFIEEIGNNIDLVYIDNAHSTPIEMINFLEVLPFLKEEALVVLYDTFLNIQLLCNLRGKLILPKYGERPFNRNIGALELFYNQRNYFEQYFLSLGSKWEYLPDQKNLYALKKFFKKYYGRKMTKIFDDAVSKNRKKFSREK